MMIWNKAKDSPEQQHSMQLHLSPNNKKSESREDDQHSILPGPQKHTPTVSVQKTSSNLFIHFLFISLQSLLEIIQNLSPPAERRARRKTIHSAVGLASQAGHAYGASFF